MKKILYVLIASLFLASCASEDQNVEVTISSSSLPLIPATAISCLAVQNAGGDAPTADISPSYFKIPTITFSRKDASKILIIAFIRINVPIPGSATPVSCEVGGDALAALKSTWFASSTKEAAIAAGTATDATDCPLYCGGIAATTQFTSSGTMEVFGLERDAVTLEETPVRIQTTVTIQNF